MAGIIEPTKCKTVADLQRAVMEWELRVVEHEGRVQRAGPRLLFSLFLFCLFFLLFVFIIFVFKYIRIITVQGKAGTASSSSSHSQSTLTATRV